MDVRLEYDVVDVFTDEPFAGNALAVVHGAQGLSAAAMQAVATEFQLSETAFPLVRGSSASEYDIRIFTPQTELAFAGHPSIGSAWSLVRRGLVRGPDLVQHCGAGPVAVRVGEGDDDLTWLTGAGSTAPLLAVGLSEADLVGLPTVVAGTGLRFCYLFVRPGSVARATPDLRLLRQLRPLGPDLGGVAVVGWHDGAARARVFTDDIGAAEDPATGSAALGLAVVLVAQGLLPGEGESRFTVSQGIEMGRPSVLHCQVDARGGQAVGCRVGGQVVPVASGTMVAPRR
jgi:trans-2,3-dihydro-3-hydroxyanthranilate isomerase